MFVKVPYPFLRKFSGLLFNVNGDVRFLVKDVPFLSSIGVFFKMGLPLRKTVAWIGVGENKKWVTFNFY